MDEQNLRQRAQRRHDILNMWSGSTLESDDPWNDQDFHSEEIYQKHFGKGARNDN